MSPPVRTGPDKKRPQDDVKGIAQALKIGIRTHCMDSAAVRATVALDPEGFSKWLKVPEHKTMPPESVIPATGATVGLLPWILSAKSVKLLYITSEV